MSPAMAKIKVENVEISVVKVGVGFEVDDGEAGARDARPYRLSPVMFAPQWINKNPQATGEYADPKTGTAKSYKYKQSFPVRLSTP